MKTEISPKTELSTGERYIYVNQVARRTNANDSAAALTVLVVCGALKGSASALFHLKIQLINTGNMGSLTDKCTGTLVHFGNMSTFVVEFIIWTVLFNKYQSYLQLLKPNIEKDQTFFF